MHVALFLSACARGVIVLSPPASHYNYYNSVRGDIYEFVADFQRAAAQVNETLLALADRKVQVKLRDGYGVSDVLRCRLDDIWMRDLFVMQLSDTTVVHFTYDPKYMDTQSVQWIAESAESCVQSLWPDGNVKKLELVLDGGNIVWEPTTRRAILTERVLRDNPGLLDRTSLGAYDRSAAAPYAGAPSLSETDVSTGAAAIASILSGALGGASVAVAILPEEPSAPRLGHIDGVANWLAKDTVALSHFADDATRALFEARLTAAFGSAVTIVHFPYAPTEATWGKDGFESSAGVYVNFARTEKALYIPVFGLPEDAQALAVATTYGDRPPIAVDASQVAIMGGSVRCLSAYLWGPAASHLVALASSDADGPSPSTMAAIAASGAIALMLVALALLIKMRRARGGTMRSTTRTGGVGLTDQGSKA